jgi:hypothetical protein
MFADAFHGHLCTALREHIDDRFADGAELAPAV